jgi:hypothetical protein
VSDPHRYHMNALVLADIRYLATAVGTAIGFPIAVLLPKVASKIGGMSQGGGISRKLIEDLLSSFLSGALGLRLLQRIEQLEKIPSPHRERLLALEESAIGIAWVTDRGVVSATGRYDPEQSRGTYSHVVMIEYWIPPDTHHLSWWRADPQHPTEWTAGRG